VDLIVVADRNNHNFRSLMFEELNMADDKHFTVIVLQGDRVVHHGSYVECAVNQSRDVTPQYAVGYQNWGQADSLRVEPNSECVTIFASGDLTKSVIAGKHDAKGWRGLAPHPVGG
jgi:hypothetical protein